MVLEFTKMSGAGNDFVLLDGRATGVNLTREQVVRLCDRHRGIGADGLVVLRECGFGKADWAWEFYNSDGSTGEMCGNAARCFGRYVQRQTGHAGDFTFQTEAGIITARFDGDRVTVDLTRPEGLRLNQPVPLSLATPTVHFVNTGVPHVVLFVPDADQAMVREIGAEIRRHPLFAPRGTNVNFVQVLGPGRIRVRTFERGVEGETLACGTGVAAAALISARVHGFPPPVKVRVQGGDELEVSFNDSNGEFSNVGLSGPAHFVFEGSIQL
jgi:diaminopimelate epimerase